MPGSNRRFSGTLEHPPPRRDAMDRRHSNASDISLPDSNHIRQLSQENIEYIPTRCTKITAPKPAANPLQFIKVGPASLYKSAQEQLKKVEEIKKVTKEVRDEAEDWQSNLDNWKSSRRKRQEHIIERVVEVKKFEMEEYDRNRRRSKTFNEMMEERNSRGRKVSLVVFQDDDANDLSDLGISTSSGKSSISEDYGNEDHHNANEREETKGNDEQGTQRRNGVHEEDTSSSVATASSPEPEEYTYERAIQGYVNFAETRVKSRPAVTNNNSEERSTLGVNGEKLSNGHGGKTPPPTPRRPSAAKIEEKLSALEQRRRSGSSTDLHNSDIKKPTISVPKVDINKRRELFERACENNNKPVLPSRKLSGELSSPKRARNKSSEVAEVKKDNKISSEISSSVKERLSNLEKSAESGGSEKEVEHPKHRLSNGDVSVRERLSHIEGQTLVESEAERVQTNRLSGDLSESIKERLSNLDSACNKDNNKKVTPDRDPGFQEKLANFRNTEVKTEDSEGLVNGFDSQGKDLGRPYSPEEDLVYQNKKQQFHRSLDSLDVESSENVCNEVFERVQSLEELECCNRSRNYPASTSSTEMMAFSSQGGDTDREDREDSGIHTADVSCSVSQADEPVEDSEIITTISSVVPHLETSSTGADVLHLEVELVNHKQPLNTAPDGDASKSEETTVGHLNVEDKIENKTTGADSVISPTSSLVSHGSLDVNCPLPDDARLNFPEHATNTGDTDCMEIRVHEVTQEDESQGVAEPPEVIIQEDDSSFQELPDAIVEEEDQGIQELTALVKKDEDYCIQDQIPCEAISEYYDPVFQEVSDACIKTDDQSNRELFDIVKIDDQSDQELYDVVNKADDQSDQELSDVIRIYDQGVQVLSDAAIRVDDLGVQEISVLVIQLDGQGVQDLCDDNCIEEVSNVINNINNQGVGEISEITTQVDDQIIQEILEIHDSDEHQNVQEHFDIIVEVDDNSNQKLSVVTNKIDDQELPRDEHVDEISDAINIGDNQGVQELPDDQFLEVVCAVVSKDNNQCVQELSDVVYKVEDQGIEELSYDQSVEQLSEVINKVDDVQELSDIVYKVEDQGIQELSYDQSVEQLSEVINNVDDFQEVSDIVYKVEDKNIQELSYEVINKVYDVQELSDIVYKVEEKDIQELSYDQSVEQLSEVINKVDDVQELSDVGRKVDVHSVQELSDDQCFDISDDQGVREVCDIAKKEEEQTIQELPEAMKDDNQAIQESSNVPECISLEIASDSPMPINESIEEEVESTENVEIQEEQSETVRTDSNSSLMEESDKATTDSSTDSHSDETVVSTGVEVSNIDIVHDNGEQTIELIGDSNLCMSSNADSCTNLLDSEVMGNDDVPSSDPTSSPDKVCMQNEVSAERRKVFEKIEVTEGVIEDRSPLPTPFIEVPHPITEQIKEMESTKEDHSVTAEVTEIQMEQVNIVKSAENQKISDLAVEQVPSGAKDSGNGTDEELSLVCKTSAEQSAVPPPPQNTNIQPAKSAEGHTESDEVFVPASQIPPLNLSSDVEIVAGLEFPLGPPTSAEPPKEKPPPPPTELSDEEVAPVTSLKRLDSTKRIKKEIRRKRSDFLGIEGGNDDSYLEPELKVVPPPDMTSFLVEEQRSEKQLYRQSICSETDSYHGETTESRDSGVELDRAHSDDWPGKQSFTPEILSAQHSRQNSDIYGTASVTSEEDEIMKKEREIIEILEKEEQWRYRNKASAEENDIGEKLAEKLHQLEQEKMRLEWERAEEENRRQMKENARIEEEMRLKAKEEELRQQENIVANPKRKSAGTSKEEFVPSGEALHAERERLRRESEQLLREKETLQLREQQRHWNSSSALPHQHWTHETSPIPQTHLSLQDISAVPTNNVTMYHMASPTTHKTPPFNYRLSLPDLQQEQQMQSPQPLRPVSMMPTPRTNPNLRPQPPIPPAKPLRVVSQEQRERENSIRNSRLPSADSLPQHLEPVHLQHHHGPAPSGQPLSRQTLQALSAVPRSRFISNDMWMQPKKKPENQRSGGREQNYNYQHWLIQEAEHRRITEQQQRNAMPPRKPPSQPPAWNNSQTPPRQDKPLPDSIIQTLTQRVQNRAAMQENKTSGVSARRRIEESPCRDPQPQQQQQPMPHPGHMPASHPALGNGDTQEKMLSVSGKKKCSHCGEELGRGAAMIIESLRLFYHIDCFKCCVCHVQLGDGLMGTDVRVRNNKLHCHNCYSSDDGVKFSCV